jgi:hypothetical protein
MLWLLRWLWHSCCWVACWDLLLANRHSSSGG